MVVTTNLIFFLKMVKVVVVHHQINVLVKEIKTLSKRKDLLKVNHFGR
jgi:hypothetical protein